MNYINHKLINNGALFICAASFPYYHSNPADMENLSIKISKDFHHAI